MKKQLLLCIAMCMVTFAMNAQVNKCATMDLLDSRIKKDPSLKIRMEQSEIETQQWIASNSNKKGFKAVTTIPVVVHVIYHEAEENISNEQIQSQIDILNKDFRKLNTDTLASTHPFSQHIADSQIEFCLASIDPDGNSTTGITRTHTDSVGFAGNGSEKSDTTGGINNWNALHYLNIWVVKINGNSTLGYAQFPYELDTASKTDGVVIHYQAFGNIGTAGGGVFSTNAKGRTATHEVGHWLNLRHIWGDEACGNDFVDDTKTAKEDNSLCPTFPHNAYSSCSGSDANGEMYMNYMDYVDDHCMNMFTNGQSTRMAAVLNGDRLALKSSNGCGITQINELAFENNFAIAPNPSNGKIVINSLSSSENTDIVVYNLIGSKVAEISAIKSFPYTIDLSELSNGIYYLKFSTDNRTTTQKILISK
jgi:hypothetical protein